MYDITQFAALSLNSKSLDVVDAIIETIKKTAFSRRDKLTANACAKNFEHFRSEFEHKWQPDQDEVVIDEIIRLIGNLAGAKDENYGYSNSVKFSSALSSTSKKLINLHDRMVAIDCAISGVQGFSYLSVLLEYVPEFRQALQISVGKVKTLTTLSNEKGVV